MTDATFADVMQQKQNHERLKGLVREIPLVYGPMNDCPYCRTIFISKYGVRFSDAKHDETCPWRLMKEAAE